jgi:hypothetical protein
MQPYQYCQHVLIIYGSMHSSTSTSLAAQACVMAGLVGRSYSMIAPEWLWAIDPSSS